MAGLTHYEVQDSKTIMDRLSRLRNTHCIAIDKAQGTLGSGLEVTVKFDYETEEYTVKPR